MNRSIFALSLLAAALTATATFADGTAPAADPRAAVMQYCPQDFQTYCSQTTPQTPERRACIKENFAKFSQPCQDAMKQLMQGMGGGGGGNGGRR